MKQAMQAPFRASATATPSRMRALIRTYSAPIGLGKAATKRSRSARLVASLSAC